jgi:hypothetical protein
LRSIYRCTPSNPDQIGIATHDPRWFRESQRTIHLFDGQLAAGVQAVTSLAARRNIGLVMP